MPAPRPPQRVLTFLVVDDEPFIIEYVRRVLSRLGHRVVAASDGEEALACFQRDASIDFLITDIVMPGSFDGFGLAKRVLELRPTLPVVYITGALSDDDPRATELTARRILLKKPFFPAQLVEILQEQMAAAGLAA